MQPDDPMRHSLKSIMAAALVLVPGLAGAQTVTEPSSKVAFPVELESAGGRQLLAGTGIRTKTMLKVKVYAFGIYVDPAVAREKLVSFAGKDATALARDPKFYQGLLTLDIPMTLRLVMTRNVAGADMAEAFDGALRPRVQKVAKELPGGETALGTFRGLFSLDKLTKGTVLDFKCTPDGTLASTVGGEAKPALNSKALCWALFDVYLGDQPIMAEGKRTVIARVPEILAGR
jgi:hypothetical protein